MTDSASPITPLPPLPSAVGPAVPALDLHMHSTASDGLLAPAALIRYCAEHQVRWVALTDHDTLEGIPEARLEAEQQGVALLAGAEISSQWGNMGIHVVALLPQGESGALAPSSVMAHAFEVVQSAREARAEKIAQRLEKKGLPDALEKARALAGGRSAVGRPHFAQALVDAGVVPDHKEAFKRYLGAGKVGDIKTLWPSLQQVVQWIVESGGVAVLAHPLRYGLTRRRRGLLLDDFVAAGGQAAELVSGFENSDKTRDLARQLHERQLYASFGSDFHRFQGPFAPGRYSPIPEVAVPPVWTHPLLAPWFEAHTVIS